MSAFEHEPWFKGAMSREDAEQYLRTHTTTASFLVRNSSAPGVLCVSVRLKSGAFSHTLISPNAPGGMWTIEQKEAGKTVVAPTLRALLEQLGYLKSAFITTTSPAAAYSPIPPAHAAAPIYDAMAPALNEISVSKRGELRRAQAEKGIMGSSGVQPVAPLPPSNNSGRFGGGGGPQIIPGQAPPMGILMPGGAPPVKAPAPSALMGPPVAFPVPGRALYGAPRDGLPVARPTAPPPGPGGPPPHVAARGATLKGSQDVPLPPPVVANTTNNNNNKPLPTPMAQRPLSPRSLQQQQSALAQSPPHAPQMSPPPPPSPQQAPPPLLRPRGDTQFSPMTAAAAAPMAPAMTPVRAMSAAPAAPAAESHYSTVPTQRQDSLADELWYIAPGEISVGEVVGRGNFGVVLRGEWRGMQVAVKQMVINADALSSQQRADFKRECAVLKQVRPHRNVVQFLGLTRVDGHDAIVLDFCGGGSLESALLDPAGGGCEWLLADKLAIAHDCGAGLTHLHREGIVHRDIAARNVLLDSFPFVAKLSDFGMSRQLQDAAADAFTSTRIGPARWSSPEMIEKGSVSTRSDVFMFAVLLFEIFERAKPWAAFDPTAAAFEVLAGRRMQLSANTPQPMAELMYACWAHDPMQRPRMEDVLGQVKAAWLQVHAET